MTTAGWSDLQGFVALMRSCFTADTTETPNHWTPERPGTGHCAVAAILIRDHFGGTIVQGWASQPGGAPTAHFWNRLQGLEVDATWEQFGPTWVRWGWDPDALRPPQLYRLALAGVVDRAMRATGEQP